MPLGYGGLSTAARQSGEASVSLDFLDAGHVLLTFNPKKLFRRLPDCPPAHNDRLIHAMILEIPGGKVVRETDWYLHDLQRYIWPMGSGRFLLRRLNQLYEVDSNFAEKLVLDSPKELLWVSVTPDGKGIIAETLEEAGSGEDEAKKSGRVKITFLDAESLAVQRVIESRGTVNLGATSSGFADVVHRGNVWMVRFGPTVRDRINIARIKARRSPNILYSSANTLLIGRCSLSGDGYSVSAFTLTGSALWRQHWKECRYTPVVRSSEDGSRFAAGTLTIRPARLNPPASPDSDDPEAESLEQTVQVFDTATGNAVLSVKAMPAVLDGQNASLSPDGGQLAVMAGTAINIYTLREMSPEERTKYLAVKSDAPGLYVPPPQAGQQATSEEPIYSSAENEEAAEAEQQNRPSSSTSAAQDAAKPPSVGTPASASSAAPAVPTAVSPGTEPPALTLRTGTQVVALDVVVTDSKGRLIKGLQQGDFAAAENGKPQTIRYFREYAGAEPSAPSPPPPAKELPPNVFSNNSQPVEAGAVTVVLLDLLNTPLADQVRAQAELIKFLKSKPKDSQFALCTLGDKLQMIQGFTQDGNILLAAANGKKASLRHRSLLDSDTVLRSSVEVGKATSQFLPSEDLVVQSLALQQSEARVLDADRRMYITVDAFAHLARYLSGIPGRKNLVWLSGSFTLGISPDTSGQDPFIQARNYSDNLKKVSNLLGESHVAVYPVDVKGLETDPMFSSASNDTLAPSMFAGSAGGGTGPAARNATTAVPLAAMRTQAEQFGLTRMGEQATMDQLAADTGGQAFYNTNGIVKAISTAAEQGSNYYALSYTPVNKKYDGAFRKVKVSLAGKKYHLAYRNGYYAVDPYAPVKPSKDLTSSLALAAMQQGSPQSRQIVFGARVVPLGKPRVVKDVPTAQPSKRKRKGDAQPVEMQRYSIDYAVTPKDLQFSPTPDGTYHDILNFMITIFDDDGQLVSSQVSQVDANLKPEVFRDIMLGGVRMHQEIDVPVKSVAMRLGVEDMGNSHIGTTEIPLPVKAPPEAPAVAGRSLPPVEPD